MAELTTAQLATDLVNEISNCLINGQLKEARTAIHDNKYSACVKGIYSDLIPIIAQYMDDETITKDSELFECCEELLGVIAEKSNPKEAVLGFIEEAEFAKNDTKFIAILKVLQKTLLKLTNKRGLCLEWSFGTIQAYLSKLPLPGDYNLESEEKVIMDADTAVNRITLLYSQLLPFYEPFINEVALPNNASTEHKQRRDLIACFMLQLLGKPLACLDLECDAKSKNRARVCTEEIMNYLSILVSDCYKFLEYIVERPEKDPNDTNGVYEGPVQDVFACEKKAPTLSLGVYFYLLLSENIQIKPIPIVYNPIYVLQSTLYLATDLLKQPEQFITRKGILLAHTLICGDLVDTFPFDVLDSTVHCHFCQNLTNVMIYSDIKQYRELCLKIFKTYLFKFDTKGRYLLMSNLVNTIKHINTRGYLITQYKDMICEIMSKNENKISEYFSGQKLYNMIDTFCSLPEGPKSDLIEIGDQIITSLNLLIFLSIRDKYNVTGIWNHFHDLDKNFFKPLKEGLILSKAHYELKIKELGDEKCDDNLVVSVAEKHLPELSRQDKSAMLRSSLNSFGALEMLLARVEELVGDGPEITV